MFRVQRACPANRMQAHLSLFPRIFACILKAILRSRLRQHQSLLPEYGCKASISQQQSSASSGNRLEPWACGSWAVLPAASSSVTRSDCASCEAMEFFVAVVESCLSLLLSGNL